MHLVWHIILDMRRFHFLRGDSWKKCDFIYWIVSVTPREIIIVHSHIYCAWSAKCQEENGISMIFIFTTSWHDLGWCGLGTKETYLFCGLVVSFPLIRRFWKIYKCKCYYLMGNKCSLQSLNVFIPRGGWNNG